jgi:thymidylate synthase (FAD)
MIRVLDHGFVTLRNISGPTRRPAEDYDADDVDPSNTARMSFDQMDSGLARGREQDLRLAEYLMKNRHTTPFEMIEVWLEMKLPIFVARQFVRHRTVSINEVSGRYVQLPAEWYIPKPEHVGIKPPSVKQGRVLAWDELDHSQQLTIKSFLSKMDDDCRHSYSKYSQAIDVGIPNELARLYLHLNHYTHWVWKQDLHNIMHFLSLRDHSHAQYEAQQYAKAILSLLDQVLPESMKLYRQYRALEKV